VSRTALLIGTAGWAVAPAHAAAFPGDGSTGLARYAARFRCAEINSSFHRSHRSATWERWAASVPSDFRFAAKLSKQVTHKLRLSACTDELAAAVAEMRQLGDRLAIILVQLPPSLSFGAPVAEVFFQELRGLWQGDIACEPRHAGWFEPDADALLAHYRIARVAADPAKFPGAEAPGGWRGLSYYRWHGSPVVYRSSYDDGRLEDRAERLAADAADRPIWCIFDNTASGAATGDALKLQRLLGP
jgi:uncharacterized protein YecE (DUF72 family)